jgi:exopolysaccharide production protein ExoZ
MEIKGIQYLRGVAALSVVIFHLSMQLYWMAPSSIRLSSLASGVDLFFVISGYIMVYSTGGGTKLSALEFLIRRMIRIVPLYWLATAAAVIVLLIAPKIAKQTILAIPHVIASFAFLPASHPSAPNVYAPLVYVGWTLNYEMLFYVLFAIGIAAGSGLPNRVVAITSAPILILSAIGLFYRPTGILGFYANPIMIEFLLGMYLALALSNLPKSKIYALLSLAGLVALFALPDGPESDRVLRYGLIASIVVGTAVLGECPKVNLLHLMGDASYSIYISHFFVLSAFAQLWTAILPAPRSYFGVACFYSAGILCAASAGLLCWSFVERPLSVWINQTRRAVFGAARVKVTTPVLLRAETAKSGD